MLYGQVHLTLPAWIHDAVDPQTVCADDESRVALAIELSRLNIANATGGPFGAAVFDEASGRLIGIGVNRVLQQSCSVAHAEMMAYMTAQARSQKVRLNEDGTRIVLATSAQPCCMCYGATFWAGIDTLLIGARSTDVMELTAFDEGPLPDDWIGELEKRGISVRRDILRDRAREVLARLRQRRRQGLLMRDDRSSALSFRPCRPKPCHPGPAIPHLVIPSAARDLEVAVPSGNRSLPPDQVLGRDDIVTSPVTTTSG